MKNLNNRVQLIGRLGISPEIKSFGEDRKMARMQLATSESFRNAKGEQIEKTQWHSLVAWGKLADVAEKYFKSGLELAVDGKLTYRKYEDADGKKHFYTEVVVQEFLMLRSGKK